MGKVTVAGPMPKQDTLSSPVEVLSVVGLWIDLAIRFAVSL